MDSNFRENLESQGLPLFTRTPPRIPSLPQPSPRPPAPPRRALPPASPASPGRCFSLAEPSPTRVAACSRELIPAGRSRRLPGPAAPLGEGAPRPALRSRPARPPAPLLSSLSSHRRAAGPDPHWPAHPRPLRPAPPSAGRHEVTGLRICHAPAGPGRRWPPPRARCPSGGSLGHPSSPESRSPSSARAAQ